MYLTVEKGTNNAIYFKCINSETSINTRETAF